MTKARQDATIRKIERNVGKHIPETNDADFMVDGYDDEMGENIQDLESEAEGEGDQGSGSDENQRAGPDEGNQRAESSEGNQRAEPSGGSQRGEGSQSELVCT